MFQLMLVLFGILSLSSIIAIVFFERRNPSSTIAWILILLFLPIIGFIIYLFIGNGWKINKRRKYALKSDFDALYNDFIIKKLDTVDIPKTYHSNFRAESLINYLSSSGRSFYTVDNSADIYTDGQAMFDQMKDDMLKAKDHIHLLYYIFRNDKLGKEIISILTEKAKSGVSVKVIYDSLGCILWYDHKMFKSLREAGGKVVSFSPLFSTLSTSLQFNYRTHRKITVVDGKIAYLGGMNIGDEYLGKDPKLTPWRDTQIRITGPATWFAQERFLLDWCYTSGENIKSLDFNLLFPKPIKESRNLAIQVVSNGPDMTEKPIKAGILSMIYGAKKTLYIQTPYFTPDESLIEALRIASKSGVDVRILIPGIGDHWLVYQTAMGYVREVLKFGAKVYFYNGFLHAKTVSVDDYAVTIGSTNMCNRSFSINFEVNAFIYNKAFVELHNSIFLEDLKNSCEVDNSWLESRSIFDRCLYNCLRLVSPLM